MKLRMALTFLAAWTASAAPSNSCSDPYWKDTLRCVSFPNETPQANLGDVPPVPQPFTRVWLDDDPNVRCADGTTPVLYVDKAVCTNPNGCGNGVRIGEPIESNRWIFTVSGGDSCSGDRCAYFYAQPDERIFMSSAAKPPMKAMEGIHEPDPVKNPVFAAYNRVRIEKCTFDRYMGRSQELGVQATAPDGTPFTFNVYHHGFLIMQEAFDALAHGLRYTTFRRIEQSPARRRACCGASGGEKPTPVEETLPPLADAETVLFIGHSNASHGMYNNIDNLAAELAKIPGFDADVRVLFDENFLPSLENEAAFAVNAPANSDVYSSIWQGRTSGRGATFSYDGEVHHATFVNDEQYAKHGAVHDVSCLEAHAAAGTTWMCRDRQHVLFNHISTPFMVRQDFTDPHREHLDAPDGHRVFWGDLGNYPYCADGSPCEPRLNAAEFRARLEKQMQTLLTGLWTRSELARGIDRTTAPLPTYFAWMPSCGQHDGSFSDSFFAVTIATNATSFSMREWLQEFMNAPRTGVRRYQIDNATDPAGRRMTTTRCN